MPLLPLLAVGGFALFAGAMANKPDIGDLPVAANETKSIALYGLMAVGAYYIWKQLKKA